jgi:hypothetical protein
VNRSAIASVFAAAELPAYPRVARPVAVVANLIKNLADNCRDRKYELFARISARLMSAIISLQLKLRGKSA